MGLKLDMGLELDVELKLGVDRKLRLSAAGSVTDEGVVENAAVDDGIFIDGEEIGKDIGFELRGFDPMENAFMGLIPEQQE